MQTTNLAAALNPDETMNVIIETDKLTPKKTKFFYYKENDITTKFSEIKNLNESLS